VLKRNPERAEEIPEQIFLVQNFTPDLMAQKRISISHRLGDIRDRNREI
jgi:hypothetical protein